MLLDDVLPAYDVRDAHALWVHAPPGRVYAALRLVTPAEAPLFRLLVGFRALPARLVDRGGVAFAARVPLLDQFLAAGFIQLAEAPGAELVVGRVAQFWGLWGGRAAPVTGAEEFAAFREPGYAKAAVNFRLRSAGEWTRLATETRVQATDAAARRAFVRYWRLIGPGSALIRRDWLRAIRRRAETAPADPWATGSR